MKWLDLYYFPEISPDIYKKHEELRLLYPQIALQECTESPTVEIEYQHNEHSDIAICYLVSNGEESASDICKEIEAKGNFLLKKLPCSEDPVDLKQGLSSISK
jgi:hypothetical protein